MSTAVLQLGLMMDFVMAKIRFLAVISPVMQIVVVHRVQQIGVLMVVIVMPHGDVDLILMAQNIL